MIVFLKPADYFNQGVKMGKGGSPPGFAVIGNDAWSDDDECDIMLPAIFGEQCLRIKLALFVVVVKNLPAAQFRFANQSSSISGHECGAHMDRGGNFLLQRIYNFDGCLDIHLSLKVWIQRRKTGVTGNMIKSCVCGQAISKKGRIQSPALGVEINLVAIKFALQLCAVANLTQS